MHLATSLGWRPKESEQPLGFYARIYIVLHMAAHVWGPRAVEACRANPQMWPDDFIFERLNRLGQIFKLAQDRQETAIDFVTRVLDRTAALQATSKTACLEELFGPTFLYDLFEDVDDHLDRLFD